MRNWLAVAVLGVLNLTALPDALAQSKPPRLFEVQMSALFARKLVPPGASCGDYWCVSRGVDLSVYRPITDALGIVVGVSVLDPLPDSVWLVSPMEPSSGSSGVRYYPGRWDGRPLKTVHARLRLAFLERRLEVAAGGGQALAPHSFPFGVLATSVRFGDAREVGLGIEARVYRMEYTQHESPPGSPSLEDVIVTQGKSRASTRALVFFLAFGK